METTAATANMATPFFDFDEYYNDFPGKKIHPLTVL
jgi:hypothetical protein